MEKTYREKQALFLEKALDGDNLYLSGKAGTGKTFIVKEYLDQMEAQGKNVVRLAPTGIAAYNIGGQTIHSFFKIPFNEELTYNNIRKPKPEVIELLEKVDIFVIDEVSMLRPDILNAAFLTMKKAEIRDYLDKQYIFIGDLMQLEAVIKDEEVKPMKRRFGGTKFYNAMDYKTLEVENIELDEIVRQSDPEFIHHLNILRDGGTSPYFKQFITKEVKGVVLAPYNYIVDDYNKKGLAAHPGKVITFTNEGSGKAKPKDFDLPETFEVKEGCKIMSLVNKPDKGVYNGTIGTYVSTTYSYWTNEAKANESVKITINCGGIRLESGEVVPLPPIEYEKFEYETDKEGKVIKTPVGSVKGHPFKLAYALSIHKSQGLTFDEVSIDLRKPCFASGQLYTAFSRVRSPKGLRIIT